MQNSPDILINDWLGNLATETGAFVLMQLLEESSIGDRRWDYVAVIEPRYSDGAIRLQIETRRHLSPKDAIAFCQRLPLNHDRNNALLVASPFLSKRVMEICREHDIGYLDQVGNCHIETNGLYLHIEGRPNTSPGRPRVSNPFAQKSSRVARLLLTYPEQGWQVQQLAKEARISLGLASKVKDALLEDGYAIEEDGLLRARDPETLLDAWSHAYKTPYQRAMLYVMGEVNEVESRIAEWCEAHDNQYGLAEFSGAWKLSPMVRYKQACVAIKSAPSRNTALDLLGAIGAKPVESGGNLVLLVTSDESVFMNASEQDGIRVLSPIQLYLDLHQRPGRAQEGADELLRQQILPRFEYGARGGTA